MNHVCVTVCFLFHLTTCTDRALALLSFTGMVLMAHDRIFVESTTYDCISSADSIVCVHRCKCPLTRGY
jgi:hypothetical protein